MSRPDLQQLLQARAEFDEQINRVLTLLAPGENGRPIDFDDAVMRVVHSRIYKARSALNRFEDACNA